MARRFLFALVVLVARPTWGSPPLSEDRRVDAPLQVPALADQVTPAIAFGAGVYLAVWRDGNTGTDACSQAKPCAINGTRLALDGTVLDDPPIFISKVRAELRDPAVAFDGKQFLVIWDGTAGSVLGVHGAYVTPQGTVGNPFSIVSTGVDYPSVAAGGGHSLVVWTDSAATVDIHGTLLDQMGTVVKGDFGISLTDISIGDGNPPATDATVVWGGPTANNFLVAWNEGLAPNRVVVAATVEVDGTVSNGGNGYPIPLNTLAPVGSGVPDAADPIAARVGDEYFVTWVDRREDTAKRSLYGRSVSASAVLGSEFLVANPAGPLPSAAYMRPQVLGIGDRALVVWESLQNASAGYGLFGGRVAPDGSARSDGDGVALSTAPLAIAPLLPSSLDGRRAALASDGSAAFAVWQRASSGVTGYDVLTLPIDPTPTNMVAHDSLLLGRGANYQVTRSLATNGNVFLLVWEDDRNRDVTGVDIFGLRVDLNGVPIDATPFVVCNAPGDQFQASVAARVGGDFLVAWADGRKLSSGGDVDLYATRIGATGAPRDGNGFVVSNGANAQLWPTVAAANDNWLVAWEDWRNVIQNNPGIWAATVSAQGAPGSSIPIVDPSDVNHQACAPMAVWNGKHFFVAYEQPCSQLSGLTYSSALPLADLFGQWLSASGAPMGEAVTIAALAGAESAPRLALVGDRVAMAWRDQTGGEFIRGALIADGAAGLTGSPLVVASGAGTREAPAIAATDGVILFSWVESSPPGVRALRTTADLTTLDTPFVVASTATLRAPLISIAPGAGGAGAAATPRVSPPAAVAAAPSGQALIAFDLLETIAGSSVSRVHHRKLALLPRGATCSGGAGGCADGICALGVCCDTPCDGICQACGANGCVETPTSDARCGAVSCAELSTTCRTYSDVPGRCLRFGECAETASLAACTTWSDAADGTACVSVACPDGSCMGGACECASVIAFTPRQLAAAPAAGGCAVGGATGCGGPAALLLLGAALIAARASSRRARRRA
jgi:hypothetical protein